MTLLDRVKPDVSPDLQLAVERWLYAEAELLDDKRFDDWLECLADDVGYLVPIRSNRPTRDRTPAPAAGSAHIEDDKNGLRVRVKRLNTGLAWAEDPPTKTRHLITNVRISVGDQPNELGVKSNFLINIARPHVEQSSFAGERHDILRAIAGPRGFELVRRTVILDQTILATNTLSLFF
jgi:3-phenylpropionate/cinnamic acid dioxygenase small subunit